MNSEIDWSNALALERVPGWLSALWLFVGAALILFFIRRFREKKLISLSAYFVAMTVGLQIFINFPFSFSSINSIATGENQDTIILFLPQAFLISSIGSLALIASIIYFGKIRIPRQLNGIVSKSLKNFWFSRSVNLCGVIVLVAFMVGLISVGAHFGKAREFALENRSILFIFNFYNELAAFLLFNSVVYAGLTKRVLDVFIASCILTATLFIGTRSTSVLTLLASLLTIGIATSYTKILVPIIIMVALLISAIMVALLRDSMEGPIDGLIIATSILFGNNFSDVRDFAWLLAGWNGDFLYGKTIGSGLFSFIPSSFFPMRTEWGWAAYSSTLSGLDPQVHPGLRPGFFGEFFFNFGYFGVLIGGVFAGLFISYFSKYAENAAADRTLSRKEQFLASYHAVLIGSLIVYPFNSAGFFGFYVKIILIAMGFLWKSSVSQTPISVTAVRKI